MINTTYHDFMQNFVNEPHARDVVELPGIGVQHMTDSEVQQSIVADFVVTMPECGGLHWLELFRFVQTRRQKNRVLDAVIILIESGTVVEHGPYLSLRQETAALQFAMDFCGVYTLDIPGIIYPDNLIGLSDEGRDAIEQIGVEGVSDMLYAGMHYPDATTREQ